MSRYEYRRKEIWEGRLTQGEKLPSSRIFSKQIMIWKKYKMELEN